MGDGLLAHLPLKVRTRTTMRAMITMITTQEATTPRRRMLISSNAGGLRGKMGPRVPIYKVRGYLVVPLFYQ